LFGGLELQGRVRGARGALPLLRFKEFPDIIYRKDDTANFSILVLFNKMQTFLKKYANNIKV